MRSPTPVRLLVTTLLIGLLLAGALGLGLAQDPYADITAHIAPEGLRSYVAALSVDIGPRPAGSEAEAQAADTIATWFEAWGYDVSRQPFELRADGAARTSQNVIATRPGTGPVIVVGAHMDSVSTGTGADDNASGVAAMLAAAEALQTVETTRPVTFIAFGGEERGMRGSRHYVAQLTPDQLANIAVMINIDTVGAGDIAYAYAGAITDHESFTEPYTPGPTWARDLALELGAALGHDLQTSPPDGWNGFTGPWSDHYPFAEQGIPVVYFERWNWDAGDDPDWGQETTEGDILHSARDVIANVDPAKIEPVAETLAALVIALATGDAPLEE